MEEIKIGEYVRTTDGVIAKIIDIIKEDYGERGNLLYSLDRETFDYTEGFEEMSDFALPDQFVKHSKNIIDLIEVGDVIKYKELTADDKYGTIVNEKYIGDIHTKSDLKCVKEEIERKGIELLEILTKEQFARESYKVVEE